MVKLNYSYREIIGIINILNFILTIILFFTIVLLSISIHDYRYILILHCALSGLITALFVIEFLFANFYGEHPQNWEYLEYEQWKNKKQ